MSENGKNSNGKPTLMGRFLGFLRSNFFAGLFVVLPITITVVLIRFLLEFLDAAATSLFPANYQLSNFIRYDIFGIEILVGAFVLIVIGILTKNFLGAKLMKWLESLVKSIPGVRGIYGAIKQIIETVTMSNSESFREVVLIEYPRKGLWAIGFVTGKTKGEVQRLRDEELVNVFLPTTPNPTSGFLLFVPKKDIHQLHMTVDQGIKMVISAGIVTPTTAEGKAALKEQKAAPEKDSE